MFRKSALIAFTFAGAMASPDYNSATASRPSQALYRRGIPSAQTSVPLELQEVDDDMAGVDTRPGLAAANAASSTVSDDAGDDENPRPRKPRMNRKKWRSRGE